MTAESTRGAQLERRCRPRHRALYLRFHSPMPGEIVNVSEFGMAVETLIELPPGYELTFRLRRNSSQLELRGWIRWCRAVRSIATSEGKELKVFHSGVELDESAVEWLRTGAHELPLHEETDQGMVEVRSPVS